ncbi:MAG: hypothetical protein RL220_1586 [Bacteroidota bacterium]
MKVLLGLLTILLSYSSLSQTGPDRYWVQFTDKEANGYSLSEPSVFLSPRTIERRSRMGIGYNELDLPVTEAYVQEVLDVCDCMVLHRSKWFNAITIYTTDTMIIEEIAELPFVLSTRRAEKLITSPDDKILDDAGPYKHCADPSENYPASYQQISMMNGQFLHQLGLTGQGIHVAVFDAGWHLADALPCFEHIENDDRLLGTRDFVLGGQNVFNNSAHGTYVWSIMAGIMPDSLMGAAPGASYYLFRTEDPFGENIVEEDNWVAAMELADSIGVDVVNSSLGYSLFENEEQNHTYADMDGNTTRCSIAGDIAASKGILVVNSAGNSGNSPWHFITAPSDGDSVMCVGAVDASGIHAAFSSFGPSSDGDVKPDVSAMGQGTAFAALDSTVAFGNGTSFSSPMIAGMAACLWQAFPDKSNMDIYQAIRRSAHLYNNPNDSLGHGIPDFRKAYHLLAGNEGEVMVDHAVAWPTLTSGRVNIQLKDELTGDIRFRLTDIKGALADEWVCNLERSGIHPVTVRDYSHLANGTYLMNIQSDSEVQTIKLVLRK